MPKKMSKSGTPRSTKRGHRKGSATRVTARKASAARTRTNKARSQRKETNAAGSARKSGSTRAKRIRERREAQELVENVSAPPKRRQPRGPNSKASRNALAKEDKSKVRSGTTRRR
jgi:hypothetical protein